MPRPAWLKRRTVDTPRNPKQRDIAAINASGRALDAVDSRIASHGADGLPDWLAANRDGLTITDKTCVMARIIGKSFGRAVNDACREALLL
jgi:hypothetical protein